MRRIHRDPGRIHESIPFFEGEPLQPLALVSVVTVTAKSNHELELEKPILLLFDRVTLHEI